ncbi:MAG TPA: hypothetical protein VFF27_08590, partial [Bacteroidia bacterium]|nr:hypothetical protein [Bacteroidia bacterium]
MKKSLSITLALFFITILSNNIHAQTKYYKGYIVLLNGDTLNGEIRKNSKKEFDNFSKASFKNDAGEIKTYHADKVKEYVVDGSTFISRNIDGDQVFVKRLSKGVINLYELQIEVMQMNEIRVKSDYYMEKEAGEFVKIKSGKFKKQIVDVMGDNQE